MFWDSMSNTSDTPSRNNSTHPICDDFMMEDESFEDKENSFIQSNIKYDSETSIYDTSIHEQSPGRMSCDGSPQTFITRRSMDDHDHNSQDSGYSALSSNKFSPKGTLSFGSMASIDEASLDLSELEREDTGISLPENVRKLINGSYVPKEEKREVSNVIVRPTFRRALSMITNSSNTPNSSRVRSCLFQSVDETEIRSFKRPEPPNELQSPINKKRTKLFETQLLKRVPARPVFDRSHSATEDSIKSALQRSSNEPDLIGDFTKSFSLPLITGRHQDLKSITTATLASLIRGEFADSIASFKVIDCRYPYEFEGGHIAGAQNIYTKQQVIDELLNTQIKNGQEVSDKRHILIFHCEFSSERGPNLSRYLRNIDRSHNKDFYPQLHYPEVYLLDGGYKSFYETFSELCAPIGYLPMLHPDHEHNLKHFRAKSKTWNADVKCKSNLRSSSFKRL